MKGEFNTEPNLAAGIPEKETGVKVKWISFRNLRIEPTNRLKTHWGDASLLSIQNKEKRNILYRTITLTKNILFQLWDVLQLLSRNIGKTYFKKAYLREKTTNTMSKICCFYPALIYFFALDLFTLCHKNSHKSLYWYIMMLLLWGAPVYSKLFKGNYFTQTKKLHIVLLFT